MQAAALLLFIQHELSDFCGVRGLGPHPHSRPVGLSAPGQPGAQNGPPPCSHHTSLPCSRKATLALPQKSPTPHGGPRHTQGWHHTDCTAARELAGSRGKSQARAAVETWQEGWTRAAEGEKVLAPTLSPLQLWRGPPSYSPSQGHMFLTRTSQHLFSP